MTVTPELALLYHLGALPPSVRAAVEDQLSDPAVRRALRLADPAGSDPPEPLARLGTEIAAELAEIGHAAAVIRALESPAKHPAPDAALPSILAFPVLGGLEYETALAGAAATRETYPIPTGEAYVEVLGGVLVIELPDEAVPYAAIRVTAVVDGRPVATAVRRMTFDPDTRSWQLRMPTAPFFPGGRPAGPVRYAVQPATDELLDWFDKVAIGELLASATGGPDDEVVTRLTVLLKRLEDANGDADK